MKKVIVANLFIVLLTGIFLYGKNIKFSDSSESAKKKYGNRVEYANLNTLERQNLELLAKLENYKKDISLTLKLKKQNEDLFLQVKELDKANYRLLSYVGSLKNQINILKNTKQPTLNMNSPLAKKEYETIKYNKKIVHANTLNKKIKKYINPSTNNTLRAPASAPVNNGMDSAEYEIYSLEKHVIASGEDLMKVSKIYYNTHSKWKLIVIANPDVDMNRLTVGQTILVPNVENEKVVWIEGKIKLKKDVLKERKPATIEKPIYE
jgi:hypothetical protein